MTLALRRERTLTESDQRTAEELRARLLARGAGCIRRIILYGSRARGTALPDSDFDLLVIATDPVSKREEMQRLAEPCMICRIQWMGESWENRSLRQQRTSLVALRIRHIS